jgi:RNA recognition motif-containing protein
MYVYVYVCTYSTHMLDRCICMLTCLRIIASFHTWSYIHTSTNTNIDMYTCIQILYFVLFSKLFFIRWQDSGRLRGYGHIVFDTTESKSKALNQLNGQNLKNRYLNIQEAKPSGSGGGTSSNAPREQPADCRTVFVKNLPYNNITEDTILHVFRSCGKIVDGGVRLARNYQTKQLKGFGYIEFKNPEGAYSAVQRASKADGIKVGGRMCFVDYEESAMKGSFKTADGKSWQKTHGSAHSNNNGYSNSRNQSRRY